MKRIVDTDDVNDATRMRFQLFLAFANKSYIVVSAVETSSYWIKFARKLTKL